MIQARLFRKALNWKKKQKQSRRNLRSLMVFELLEPRQLLATDPFPYVVSLDRAVPSYPTTDANSVIYRLVFSEPVAGVDPLDFRVEATNTVIAGPIQVMGGGTSYDVVVTGISGNGTLRLNLFDNGSIRDEEGNGLVSPNSAIAFWPKQDFSTGQYPNSVGIESIALGNFNSDGVIDLVAVNNWERTASILLGGLNSFVPVQHLLTGWQPNSVAIGDLNKDGKVDLAVLGNTMIANGTVSVHLGNGNGTFQQQQDFAVDRYSDAMVMSDINGDGKSTSSSSQIAFSIP